jgi:dTDP-4-dehydrorhamnose reductase
MNRILIFGRDGQLGHELHRLLSGDFEITALAAVQADLSEPTQIRDAIRAHDPNLIINAAAYTAVDKAEQDRDRAFAVNAVAPGVMAEEAARNRAGLLHFSTDFVFDGGKSTPYLETDEANPINVYGESKLAGEEAVMQPAVDAVIFRTSWLYGPRGHNFLLTMMKLLTERDELKVVDDQVGTPTSIHELGRQVVAALNRFEGAPADFCAAFRGIYHLSCEGAASWFEFACAIRDFLRRRGTAVAELSAIPSSGYPTPARRPPYSVLDKSKFCAAFAAEIRDWQSALDVVLKNAGKLPVP